MNNCTVFKLESSINVVAPKFGFIPFVVTETADLYVRYKGIGKAYIMESNGSYFTVGSDTGHKTEVTLAAAETILHVSTANGCTVCLDREQIIGISASHSKINLDDVYGSSFNYLLNFNSPATFGNIINLINGQELGAFTITSSLVTGEVKEFVEEAEREGCTYNSCQIHIELTASQISFDGTTYQNYYIKKQDGLVKVATDSEFTNILGSYNGSSWS